MTDRYFDTNGMPIGGYPKDAPDGTPSQLSPEAQADYQRRQDRAWLISERFTALAATNGYWDILEGERILREVFKNPHAARILDEHLQTMREWMYARIQREIDGVQS